MADPEISERKFRDNGRTLTEPDGEVGRVAVRSTRDGEVGAFDMWISVTVFASRTRDYVTMPDYQG